MKKILALLLCAIMLCGVLAGCRGSISQDAEDKGALIPIYLATEIYNLDPAYAYLDEAGAKILGLLYEGLFEMDENGDLKFILAPNGLEHCRLYNEGRANHMDELGLIHKEFFMHQAEVKEAMGKYKAYKPRRMFKD